MSKLNQRRRTSLARLLVSSFPGKRLGDLRDAGPAQEESSPEVGGGYQSRAFLLWQEHLGRAASRCILDLGSARPETLRYFSERSCQMAVASLQIGDEPLADAPLRAQLDELGGDRRYSGALCWDLLNYMEHGALVTLGEWLAQRMDTRSVVLACLAGRGHLSNRPSRYHVVDDATLFCRASGPEKQNNQALTQHNLTKLWPDFKVERTFLLRNGMQENVMVRL